VWIAVGLTFVVALIVVIQPPGVASEGPEPVLEAYSVDRANLASLVAKLRAKYASTAGVRIASESRTGQILVLAPPEVHKEIGRLLRAPSPPPGQKTPSVPQKVSAGDPSPTSATLRVNIALRHIDWRRLEAGLARILGGPLPVLSSSNGDRATMALPTAGGDTVSLVIDRRHLRVTIDGPKTIVQSWARLVQLLDRPASRDDDRTQIVPLRQAKRNKVQHALTALHAAAYGVGDRRSGGARRPVRSTDELASMLFQPAESPDDNAPAAAPNGGRDDAAPAKPPTGADAAAPDAAAPPDAAARPDAADAAAVPAIDQRGGLIGPVQIEFLDGLDVVIIRGHKRDVDRVVGIINEIERLSAETEPMIKIYALRHVDSESLATIVITLYDEIFAPRSGRVSITPLVKPNSLLLIGREEGVKAAIELIVRLDKPVGPETQLQVFQLRHTSAEDAGAIVNEFFEDRGGLGVRVRVTADYRSNALIVQASPRDMAELRHLIEKIDVADGAATNRLQVFRLKNSLAEELAPVLQEAINGQATARPTGTGQAATSGRGAQLRSTMLTFLTVDPKGQRLLKSGILTDVKVVADTRANALVVTGPAASMPLMAALIEQLDGLPTAEAQIKVFTIINGDAVNLADMLQQLFDQPTTGGQPAVQTGAVPGESSLVPLRFSVDQRTNSIIASGSSGDLAVVEALLLRLDESDISQRKNVVYRLLNAPANDVSIAINDFLRSEREVQQIAPEAISPFQQIEREVIVVPEPVSNSLIVSATPRYFDEIMKLVEDLDRRPPMVMIQVLLAEVSLGEIDELGVELGLQDSLLFDRGVSAAALAPGFAFNNQPLGNEPGSLHTRETLGGQALSSFAVGRTNAELAYGGMVLSAGNESISVLVRALQDCRRLEVLSRPQVMTLDNQPAFVQVGARVPRITASNITTTGTVNSTVLENVGLLLGVTPRISPDGLVVMEIDAEKSDLGPVEEGIPIAVNASGDAVRSPIINITTAQTTISARSGQTVVLGGLITKSNSVIGRQVPLLGDIPLFGQLFRFDGLQEERTELLIILTPFIVETEEDVELIKQVESQRMSWCLADVVSIHGEGVLSGMEGTWNDSWDHEPGRIIYPDRDPTATEGPTTPELPDANRPVPPTNDSGSTERGRWEPGDPCPPRSVVSQNARRLHVPGRAEPKPPVVTPASFQDRETVGYRPTTRWHSSPTRLPPVR